jgi:hypothetical protein
MKKVLSFILIASMICTFMIPVQAVQVAPVGGEVQDDPAIESPLMQDAMDILKYLAGLIELTPEREIELDFDDDGEVTIKDALVALIAAAGISELPDRTPAEVPNETSAPEATAEPDEGGESEVPSVTAPPEVTEAPDEGEATPEE